MIAIKKDKKYSSFVISVSRINTKISKLRFYDIYYKFYIIYLIRYPFRVH